MKLILKALKLTAIDIYDWIDWEIVKVIVTVMSLFALFFGITIWLQNPLLGALYVILLIVSYLIIKRIAANYKKILVEEDNNKTSFWTTISK